MELVSQSVDLAVGTNDCVWTEETEQKYSRNLPIKWWLSSCSRVLTETRLKNYQHFIKVEGALPRSNSAPAFPETRQIQPIFSIRPHFFKVHFHIRTYKRSLSLSCLPIEFLHASSISRVQNKNIKDKNNSKYPLNKAIPLQTRTGPQGSTKLRLPKLLDKRQKKVVMLSALSTGRLYPPPPSEIHGTHFYKILT